MKYLQLAFLLLISNALLQAQEVLLSNSGGTLQKLVAEAQRRHATAVIDKSISVTSPVIIKGDIRITGRPGVVLTNMVRGKENFMFRLGAGNHQFSNFVIRQHPDGIAFFTEQQTGLVWTNEFDAVHVESGREACQSSRGGTTDAWCITTWKNSRITTGGVCISVFSQDGPYKALHLQNMYLESDKRFGNNIVSNRTKIINGQSVPDPEYRNHTVYAHPNVSIRWENVEARSGNLSLHHHSGNGVPGKARYLYLKKVKAGNVEMRNPDTGFIVIDSCDFAPYQTMGNAHPLVHATHTMFSNKGNGIILQGLLEHCTGGAWTSPDGVLDINNCQLKELSFRAGGKAIVRNSTIDLIWAADRDKPFEAELYNSTIGNITVSKPIGTIKADGKTKIIKQAIPAGVLQKTQ